MTFDFEEKLYKRKCIKRICIVSIILNKMFFLQDVKKVLITFLVACQSTFSYLLSSKPKMMFEDFELKRKWFVPSSYSPFEKAGALVKMARPENIVPISFLNLLGSYIVNPSVGSFFLSPTFFALVAITQLISGSAMVINDVLDIEQDRINHPDRPLPRGIVSKREACSFFVAMIGMALYLNAVFLRSTWVVADIVLITLYTSIFKKIPMMKNLVCAFIVSNTLYISASPFLQSVSVENKILLFSTIKVIFSSSFFMEVLLDVMDKEGDRKGGIYTLPVLFGDDIAVTFSFLIFSFGFVDAILSLKNNFIPLSLFLSYLFLSTWFRVGKCIFYRYDTKCIKQIVKATSFQIFFYFLSIFFTRMAMTFFLVLYKGIF